jgi:ATP-dependent Clp protease adapter protein ClpS
MPEKVLETPDVIDDEDIGTVEPHQLILFNDDIHNFDEVILQLMKALKCSITHATALAFEAHTRGKALVFTGDIGECLKVQGVLEEIGLHTQIEI